jgi:undecaprenyl-diphosphatase
VFEIFIQVGAILAVVWEFRARLVGLALDVPRNAQARAFAGRLALAFAPLALLGLLFHEVLVELLFHPRAVAAALVVGALLILVVEARPRPVRTCDVQAATWRQALAVGLAQCMALWPGFSRSAATILGGLLAGMERRVATEYSFFLAIPTLGAAAGYHLLQKHEALAAGDAWWLALATAVSFLVAWGSVRWLLRFVSTHSFRVFAWYRLVVGLLILWRLDR